MEVYSLPGNIFSARSLARVGRGAEEVAWLQRRWRALVRQRGLCSSRHSPPCGRDGGRVQVPDDVLQLACGGGGCRGGGRRTTGSCNPFHASQARPSKHKDETRWRWDASFRPGQVATAAWGGWPAAPRGASGVRISSGCWGAWRVAQRGPHAACSTGMQGCKCRVVVRGGSVVSIGCVLHR